MTRRGLDRRPDARTSVCNLPSERGYVCRKHPPAASRSRRRRRRWTSRVSGPDGAVDHDPECDDDPHRQQCHQHVLEDVADRMRVLEQMRGVGVEPATAIGTEVHNRGECGNRTAGNGLLPLRGLGRRRAGAGIGAGLRRRAVEGINRECSVERGWHARADEGNGAHERDWEQDARQVDVEVCPASCCRPGREGMPHGRPGPVAAEVNCGKMMANICEKYDRVYSPP